MNEAFSTPDCSGTATGTTQMGPFPVEAAGGQQITGWYNNQVPTGLGSTPTATRINTTFTDPDTGVESVLKSLLYIDDTVTPRVMYSEDGGGPVDADGYPTQLHGVDFRTEVVP